MIRRTVLSLSALLLALIGMAQPSRTVAFYNTENLFDTIPSHSSYDEDMLPLADKRWNSERYTAKLQLISQTLASISNDHPALIGLAEVENQGVVEDLVSMPALTEAHYSICHYDSDDERGIDVALLYRPDLFHLEGSRAIKPTADNSTRDILTAWGEMDGHQIFIVVMHWPSRIGGDGIATLDPHYCNGRYERQPAQQEYQSRSSSHSATQNPLRPIQPICRGVECTTRLIGV